MVMRLDLIPSRTRSLRTSCAWTELIVPEAR